MRKFILNFLKYSCSFYSPHSIVPLDGLNTYCTDPKKTVLSCKPFICSSKNTYSNGIVTLNQCCKKNFCNEIPSQPLIKTTAKSFKYLY